MRALGQILMWLARRLGAAWPRERRDPLDDIPPEFRAELVRLYEATFCGECGAGPGLPKPRCPKCWVVYGLATEAERQRRERLVMAAREIKAETLAALRADVPEAPTPQPERERPGERKP